MKTYRLLVFIICAALFCGCLTSCDFFRIRRRGTPAQKLGEPARTVSDLMTYGSATEAPRTEAVTEESSAVIGGVRVTQGKEIRYVGRTTYPGIQNLELSFILSADKRYIYDVLINISGMQAEVVDGIKTTKINAFTVKQQDEAEHNVNFEGTTEYISLGNAEILNLYFEGNTAHLELDYTFVSQNVSDTETVEFDFGTQSIICEAQPIN